MPMKKNKSDTPGLAQERKRKVPETGGFASVMRTAPWPSLAKAAQS